MEKLNVTAENLDEVMGLDASPIEVHEDGTVTRVSDVYTPEVVIDTDEDGQITAEHEDGMVEYVRTQGWEMLSGYTSQYGYRGPIMHVSEYIGGDLARDILAEPGIYTTAEVTTADDDDQPTGWVVLKKIIE